MTKTPITMTYSIVIANYRNGFNQKFPGGETNKTQRNIIETNAVQGRVGYGGRGLGQSSGQGQG